MSFKNQSLFIVSSLVTNTGLNPTDRSFVHLLRASQLMHFLAALDFVAGLITSGFHPKVYKPISPVHIVERRRLSRQ